jgi:heparan-alpha-glucosaminide N-acetyltransferase
MKAPVRVLASPDASPGLGEAGGRLLSLDVVRGLVVLLMLFVNDMPGVAGTPAWLKHIEPPDADGLTLPDFVFPAFLVVVGLSIPFAIEARRARGQSWVTVWRHVLVRTISLLIIGVFMVNDPAGAGAAVNPYLWRLLSLGGVILVWNDWRAAGRRGRLLRAAGVAVLVLSALLYRSPGPDRALVELTPQWWGILGLIGWAYLVASAAYCLGRREPAGLVGAMALLYGVYLANSTGVFSGVWLDRWVDIGGILGANGGMAVSGTVLGTMLLPGSRLRTPRARWSWACIYGACLLAAALLLHTLHDLSPVFIYNKISSTPPTGLLTAALVSWLWAAVYVLVDVHGWQRWARPLASPGRNALFIFVLGPILYYILWWSPAILGGFEPHGALGSPFALGLARAIGWTVLVAWLAQVLRRAGVTLRV